MQMGWNRVSPRPKLHSNPTNPAGLGNGALELIQHSGLIKHFHVCYRAITNSKSKRDEMYLMLNPDWAELNWLIQKELGIAKVPGDMATVHQFPPRGLPLWRLC